MLRLPPLQVPESDMEAMKNAIEVLLASFSKPAAAVRPKLSVPGVTEDRQELLHTLMDTYVKNDVLSIQQSIVNRECGGGACRRPPGWQRRLRMHAAQRHCHSAALPAAFTCCIAASHCMAVPGSHPQPPAWLTCWGPRADVEYTMARSRYKFDDLEAYMATAYSVRDRLIEEWNDTQ